MASNRGKRHLTERDQGAGSTASLASSPSRSVRRYATVVADLNDYEIGPLLAVIGKEGCEDVRCTRMGEHCAGYHCPYCGEPCSMVGHKRCSASDPREAGR